MSAVVLYSWATQKDGMEMQLSSSYNVSDLAKFFHSFPHYNLLFDPVSPDFNPQYSPYQEVGKF